MEPNTKINVEFKPSKKMKKRRELDALVSSSKPRRKSSSSHELLRSVDSESSDVEDYRHSNPKPRGPCNHCSTCTSITGLLLLIACLLVCAGLTWMHVEMKKEIESLRRGLETVETRSEGNVQNLNTLVVQLSEVNKTVHSIQTGKNGLNEVIKNISTINDKISKLSNKVGKLSASLEAAPELRQIPDKLQTVSKTVVNLGSEVTGMKDKVESFTQFVKTTSSRLDGLDGKMNEKDMSTKTSDVSDLSPELANKIQSIPRQLDSLNVSLMTQISLLQSSLTENEGRVIQLENTTASLVKNLSSFSHVSAPALSGGSTGDLKAQVAEIVQEVVKENGPSDINIDQKTMDQLLGNIDNLTATVQGLKENYNKLSAPGKSTVGEDTENRELMQLLNTFEDGLNNKLKVMNTSVVSLRHDLNHYAGIIVQHSNQLVDVTHQISEIHRYVLEAPISVEIPSLSINQSAESPQGTKPPLDTEDKGKTGSAGSGPVTIVTEAPGGGVKSHTSTVGGTKTTAEVSAGGEKTKSPDEASTETTTTTGLTTANPDVVRVSWIHNITDLETNFLRWDQAGNGKVSYEILPGYLGKEKPSREQLEKFDTNHDDLYSFEELAEAFGYSMDDLPPNSIFRKTPPR